jgi:predicted ArsR family transcriptional regulator
MEGKPLAERVRETVAIMEEQGCVVDCRQADADYYIDEFTCPFPKVAQQDHAICVLHVDFIRILTGADTRLTESLLRGQRACSHRIRGRGKAAAST